MLAFTIMILGFYFALVGILVAVAAVIFWALLWPFDVGRTTAAAISVAVALLSLPMVVAGHGVGIIPLALGMLSEKAEFLPSPLWSAILAPAIGWTTYVVLRRVWHATVGEE